MRLLKTNLVIALATIFVLTLPMVASAQLIVTGVFDGPLSGGTPKGIELYVVSDIADLSVFAVGTPNNDACPGSAEFTFPADAATAGDFIYISSEAPNFEAFFGFASNYTSGAMAINGDDDVEVFMDGVVIDFFGVHCEDASGTPWDSLDGWAYRVANTGPDGDAGVLENWMFSGINIFDGVLINADAVPAFPIGTYTMETVGTSSETMDSIKALFRN